MLAYDVDARRARQASLFADVTATRHEDLEEPLSRETAGLGADIVLDAVGVEPSWQAALHLVRPGGTVAEIGLGQAEGVAPVGRLVREGIAWKGVYAYTPAHFARALELLTNDPPPLDWVTSARLDDGPGLLAALASGTGPTKAVFEL